jgi:aryl-alcohol dehydrogenase-like predicted oxidoreductase
MDKRPLGESGMTIAPLIFGGNVFGWTLDEQKSFELLDTFVAMGFNCIDTANSYSRWVPGNHGGESETIIGKWMDMRGNRDQITVITKVGSDVGQGKCDLSRAHILRQVDLSLKRLKTDYIDMYLTHHDDLTTPVAETMDTYGTLVAAGKVRAIGASNLSVERLSESLELSRKEGIPAYQVLQPLYNLYDREPFEKDLAAFCVRHGISVIPYYALASGFLSGKYRTTADAGKSPRGEGVTKKYLNDRGIRILDALDEATRVTGETAATLSLAWLLSKPGISAPIASATSVEQLKSLAHAVQVTLSPEIMHLLDTASGWQ